MGSPTSLSRNLPAVITLSALAGLLFLAQSATAETPEETAVIKKIKVAMINERDDGTTPYLGARALFARDRTCPYGYSNYCYTMGGTNFCCPSGYTCPSYGYQDCTLNSFNAVGLSRGQIIGIAIGCVVAFLVLCAIAFTVFCCCCRKVVRATSEAVAGSSAPEQPVQMEPVDPNKQYMGVYYAPPSGAPPPDQYGQQMQQPQYQPQPQQQQQQQQYQPQPQQQQQQQYQPQPQQQQQQYQPQPQQQEYQPQPKQEQYQPQPQQFGQQPQYGQAPSYPQPPMSPAPAYDAYPQVVQPGQGPQGQTH